MLREKDLHAYQRACVEHIIANPFCGVFLDMGLGKTVSTLTAVNTLMYDMLEVRRVLVIAPKRVAETVWAEEAARWEHLRHLRFSKVVGTERKRVEALGAGADIYVISRDNVAWLCSRYGGGKLPFDMVVVDELSSFKSHKSMRFKALRGVRPSLRRLVGLTGTPAPNGLIDLWPQIYLMDRGERLGKTVTAFREMYFRPDKSRGQVVYSYKPLEGSENRIHDRIKDICISMKAEDYLEMPERIDNRIRIPMPDDLRKRYRDFERERVMEIADRDVTVASANGMANKLLQFADGAVYADDGTVCPVHDLKLEALKEIVDTSNGQPVLVAWTYKFDRDRIMEYLKEYGPRELKGGKDIEDWNAGRIRVMIAHPASAGHGLNLQVGGNIVVWFGLTWSLELYQQFNGRLYRQGQRRGSVIIHHLVLEGTHDEEVIRALASKDETQDALMKSIKAKIDEYLKGR